MKAIKGFPKKNVASYLIFEIIKLIISLKLNNITIAFLWVPPGHSNVQGNEQVDRLANTASVTNNSLDIDLPIRDVNSIVKKYSLKIWNEYWNKSSKIKGSHLFSILPKVPNEPWFEKIKLFRRISTQMARLRIGNFPTPANLNKIGLREDPFCNCDHSSYGVINHIYLGSNRNVEKINRLYLEISEEIAFPTSINILLSFEIHEKELSNKILIHFLAFGPLTKYDENYRSNNSFIN